MNRCAGALAHPGEFAIEPIAEIAGADDAFALRQVPADLDHVLDGPLAEPPDLRDVFGEVLLAAAALRRYVLGRHLGSPPLWPAPASAAGFFSFLRALGSRPGAFSLCGRLRWRDLRERQLVEHLVQNVEVYDYGFTVLLKQAGM
jgi:hypothetical protein